MMVSGGRLFLPPRCEGSRAPPPCTQVRVPPQGRPGLLDRPPAVDDDEEHQSSGTARRWWRRRGGCEDEIWATNGATGSQSGTPARTTPDGVFATRTDAVVQKDLWDPRGRVQR